MIKRNTSRLTPKSDHERQLAADPYGETSYSCDIAHKHFTAIGKSFECWTDVADEGRRLWQVMFKERIDRDSPADAVISGVAAAAYSLAISSVAARLNVSEEAIECAIENHDAVGVDKFLSECKKWNDNTNEEPRS